MGGGSSRPTPGTRSSWSNPATEEEAARVAAASPADVEAAVQAAHRAFESWSQTTREERLELPHALREAYRSASRRSRPR